MFVGEVELSPSLVSDIKMAEVLSPTPAGTAPAPDLKVKSYHIVEAESRD
jgi:hypothetical protein